jgi:tRNA A58 N-methylase Trm61
VGNPFALRDLALGERVVDAGSGSGFDCFVAARRVGPRGKVVGIDMLAQNL